MLLDALVVALISPVGTVAVLGALALWLGVQGRVRAALSLGSVALLWLVLAATPVVSYAIRGSLESRYPPVAPSALPVADAIVVLGGGVRPPEAVGFGPNLSGGADRYWHAARLYHAGRAPVIVVSGGFGGLSRAIESEARSSATFLRDLGVPADAIVLEDTSRDTRENAGLTRRVLEQRGYRRVLLVTSALHMPRALAKFRAEGIDAIPAPTDHEAQGVPSPNDWIPSTLALDGTARALKEWVGLVATWR
jgi:uncharacterized SAM-binding protein YcdF (DUF218 family)